MKQASRSMHERAHATYPGGRGEQAPEGGEVAIDPLPTSPLRLAVAPHGSRLPRRPHLMHRLAGRKRLHSDTNSPPPAAAGRGERGRQRKREVTAKTTGLRGHDFVGVGLPEAVGAAAPAGPAKGTNTKAVPRIDDNDEPQSSESSPSLD
ncbi:hypothetical protein GW17_00061475 [Ensete ventricosum]|nr:hypothetical protein GW17_00061475 [Ensete ventricosum]